MKKTRRYRLPLQVLSIIWLLAPLCAPLDAQLVISEFQALNASTLADPDNQVYADWIELYNAGPGTVDLAGYSLSDELDGSGLWPFPTGTILEEGACLLVWADGRDMGLHCSFKLKGTGEAIGLYDAGGELRDSLRFGLQLEDHSTGRLSSTGNWVLFSDPSPGQVNPADGFGGLSLTPAFSPEGGFYSDAQWIELSLDSQEGQIFYTLDGSEPDSSSLRWEGPVLLDHTTVVRARSYQVGSLPGSVSTRTYFIGEAEHELPVISISTNPAHLWDPLEGIYENFREEWERPCSFELFTPEGGQAVDMNAGLRIFGGTSRASAQKSLSIHARSRYGADRIRYPLLPGREVDEYASFVLRNSANDWKGDWRGTMFRDALIHTLVEGQMDLDYMSYQPVAVYLNGEYWGIHNLRDKHNENYCESFYGVDTDSVDIIKHNEVVSGNDIGYNSMMSFLEENDLSDGEAYRQAQSMIDESSLINYLITQVYSCNIDWPANNHRLWNRRQGGQGWRWMLFDTEFGFNGFRWAPVQTNMFEKVLDPFIDDYVNKGQKAPWATRVFISMFESEAFKNRFISHYITHMATTYEPSRVVEIIDSLENMLEDEMPRHIDRWSAEGGIYSMNVWRENVEGMREFARDRPPWALANLKETFHIPAQDEVDLEILSGEGTHYLLDGIALPQKDYSATYFVGSPVSLSVFPDSAYCFTGWEIEGGVRTLKEFIGRGDEWKYLDDGTDPGADWMLPGFEDRDWKSGRARFGYGEGDEKTVVDYGGDPLDKHITTWFRKSFQVGDPEGLTSLRLEILRDDGAVVHLNGHIAARSNMTSREVDAETLALLPVSGEDESRYFQYELDPAFLVEGENILAVELHLSSANSADMGFDLELSGTENHDSGPEIISDPVLQLVLADDTRIQALVEETGDPMQLRINEICASNTGIHLDEFGEADDWIELYNPGEQPVSLTGLYLTDTLEIPDKWQIPAGTGAATSLGAGEFVLLWADRQPGQGPLHLDFKLGRSGEELGLFRKSGDSLLLIDSLRFGALGDGLFLARRPDATGPWVLNGHPTPAFSNMATGQEKSRAEETSFTLFPNPTSGLVYLRLNEEGSAGSLPEGRLQLISATGQQVLERDFIPHRRQELDLSFLEPGMYWIRVIWKGGQWTGKVVRVE